MTNTGQSTAPSNAITGGTLAGPVVQAGTITGGIHHHLAPPSPPVIARQLPRPAPHFTGRATEQAALDSARATGASMVVLSGISGVGTSALAIQWLHAQAAPAGVQLYADLTHTAGPRPEAVLQPWLRALGVDRAPAQRAEAVALWRSITAGRAVHVLIDGAVDAEQVRPLIPSGPRSLTVITSRRVLWELSADGALVLPVTPLSPRDAVRLLCAAAGDPEAAEDGAALPGAKALAEACAHLPLPLVLAGARFRSRPGRLLASPARASGPSTHLPQEHARTGITNALNDSYTALEPDARRLYRTLGVLPARTVDADLAAAVCEMPPAEAGWLLEVLADERLLDFAPDDSPDPRYRMNGAVRDHAHATALGGDTEQERDAALRRLCDWMLAYARHAQRLITPAQATLLNPGPPVPDGLFEDEQAALAWLEGQEDNFLPVLKSAESAGWDERVFGLVDVWWPFFLHRHPYALWITAHEIGVAAARRVGNEPVLRQMLASGAIGLSADGQLDKATYWYEQVLEAALAAGDVRDEGQALLGLGACHLDAGRPQRARPHLEAAVSRWESCEYLRGIGLAEITLGEVCLAEDDPAAAKVHLTSAHRRLSELTETFEASRALALHGHARVRCGESAEAIAELERALDGVASSARWRARTLEWLGEAHHHRGDAGTARTCWGRAADLYETICRSADAERLRTRAAER
ncbi:tetratricopeptide repeat protein [Streptomyces microflavus]|uniref:tetratricopeptide repeat protein n=1 Tax=Streptomyces microflavus TaxID=1919 RepID=UPI0037F758A4